jgi:hypothetical protein
MPIGLDPWFDEPANRAAQGSFTAKGTFILDKLRAHDAAKQTDVLADVYGDAVPDPTDITKVQWEIILRFMGADADEIADVQQRMGASVAIASLAILVLVLVSGCATQPPPSPLDPGFLTGLLHGLIAPIAFVISLFTDDVRLYAFPNAGVW